MAKKRNRTHTVHLHLPQSKGKPIETLYRSLRGRAFRKARDDRSDRGKKAPLLILEFAHKAVDMQMGVLVKRGTFLAFSDEAMKEQGFTVRIDSILGEGTLHVFTNGKAYVEED